jgi:DNA mismatch endonuclease, patch repair protein
MRAIKGRNTTPELTVRRELHAAGFRYRLHSPALPGKPDLALPKYRAVIFVHGCFWHKHDCPLFKVPGERRESWQAKLDANVARDVKVVRELRERGWRVAMVWECALRGVGRIPRSQLTAQLSAWLRGTAETYELRGR